MKFIVRMTLSLFIIFSLSSFLEAKLYIWTDESGVQHYSDTPPPAEVENVEVEKEYTREEMKFVYIPAGTFMMGSPESEYGRNDKEEKQRQVTLSKPFYMQTTEVTQSQWESVMGNNPSFFKDCGGDCPVENVSWVDVQEFIKRLNSSEETTRYRLPTEAEWEYACRAGTTTTYSWGNDPDCAMANFGHADYRTFSVTECKDNNPAKTVRVASYPPNKWGLYDMHGNVAEWCQDDDLPRPDHAVTDPVGIKTDGGNALHGYFDGKLIHVEYSKVYRGGSWGDRSQKPNATNQCRSAHASSDGWIAHKNDIGFRLVKSWSKEDEDNPDPTE